MVENTYVIIEIVDVTEAMVNECYESSLETLRKNNTQTHTILKWREGAGVPATIAALDPQPIQYTLSQIKSYINNPSNGWVLEV